MKKFTPVLIILAIIGVVSVSGCISIIDPDNSTQTTDNLFTGSNQTPDNSATVVQNVNKSGNIIIATKDNSDKIKNKQLNNNQPKQSVKISKDEIEKEVVRIMKLNDQNLNFTAQATLVNNDDGTPYYIVDVYDDYGWYGYFEINANTGPKGNDRDGYSFDGGAVRGETGDEPVPIEGVMPKLAHNDARQIMDNELKANYSVDSAEYMISGYLIDGTPYYNITIENSDNKQQIGYAIMNANTGEIVFTTLEKKNDKTGGQKIYSVDEAGAYIDIVYKGEHVAVRENYPYYSPQSGKIYYSQQEEAEDLYQMAKTIQ